MSHPSDLLTRLADQHATVQRLETETRVARRDLSDIEQAALKAVCPFADTPFEKRFVPLSHTRALINVSLRMRLAQTPGQLPVWEARGQEVRFRLGRAEPLRQSTIDQPTFEALPESVKALTSEQMYQTSLERELIGMDKPLKLSERQQRMFSELAQMSLTSNVSPFDPRGVEGGQPLPSGIWGSRPDTNSIWQALCKRGVLTMVSGEETGSFTFYRVNPGPRFQEAVQIVLNSPHFNAGSVLIEQVKKHLLLDTSPEAEAPAPRRPRP